MAAPAVGLGVHLGQVGSDGALRDVQSTGDLLAAESSYDQISNIALTLGVHHERVSRSDLSWPMIPARLQAKVARETDVEVVGAGSWRLRRVARPEPAENRCADLLGFV